MIHILHHQKDEIVGWITQVREDSHKNSIENEETYDFVASVSEQDMDKIGSRARFLIPGEEGDFREFVVDYIYEVTSAMEKKIYSKGSFYDLRKLKIIKPQTLDGQTIQTAVGMVLDGLPWEVGIVEYSGVRKWVIENHLDAFSALKSIASLFSCEMRFRVTVKGDAISGRYVDFIKRIGMDRGKETVFGKDLINITRKVLPERLVTALHCLGPERQDGTRLEVIVTDDAAYQNWNWKGHHLIEKYEPESTDQDMTIERLTQLGRTELNKRITAAVEYDVDAASLEHIFGYEHEMVRLGDGDRIKDEHFNPPMYLDSRVVFVDRSVFNKSKKTFKLGEVIEYKKEDVMKTWRELQALYATKVIKSPTAPPGSPNIIWIKTGGSVDIPHTWNATTGQWEKMSPTEAAEVGSYTQTEVDNKDQSTYEDGTYYADETAKRAEERANVYTEEKVQEAKDYAEPKIPDTLPAMPTGVKAEGGFKSIFVDWDFVSENYISKYQVYGSETSGFTPSASNLLFEGKTDSFAHSAGNKKTFFYKVRAVNVYGKVGPFSTEVSASTVQINTDEILFGAITAEKIKDLAVDAAKLADLAVTGQKLVDGAVIQQKIADLAVDGTKIASGAVNNLKLADLAVTAKKLASGSVTNDKIENSAVDNAKLDALAVDAAKLADGAATETKLGAGSVTNSKIGSLAVSEAKIGNLAVTSGKIANLAVGNAAIANGAITNAKIANLAVDTAQLANASITEAKIANLAVGTAAIKDLAVTNAKISEIAADKITAGFILVQGKNYVRYSAMREDRWTKTTTGSSALTYVPNGGFLYGGAYEFRNTGDGYGYIRMMSGDYFIPVKDTEDYTASIYCKALEGKSSMYARFYCYKNDGTYLGTVTSPNQECITGRLMFNLKPASGTEKVYIMFLVNYTGVTQLSNAMVQKGLIASEYQEHTEESITAGGIVADQMAVNSITASNGAIANLAVESAKIANLAVGTAAIANLAVTNAKIGNLAVNTAQITDLAVSNAKLGNLAVDNGKIGNLAVTEAKIANLAVTNAKIADLAVDDAKIKDLSADKLKANSVIAQDITFTGRMTAPADTSRGLWIEKGNIVEYKPSGNRTLLGLEDTLPSLYSGNLGLGIKPLGYGKIYTHVFNIWVPAKSYAPGDYVAYTFKLKEYSGVAIAQVMTVQVTALSKEWYVYEEQNGRVFEGADLKSIRFRVSPHYAYTSGGTNVEINVMILGFR